MLKIGDTIINKVQKSEGGATTEIPIVQTNDGTLLHLGLNTYKTEFNNSGLQSYSGDGYAPFSRLSNEKTYSTIGSNFIRTRLYADAYITKNISHQLFSRLEFGGAAYQYDVGKYCNGIEIQLSYDIYQYSPDNTTRAWANAVISWRAGTSNVPIATIESSPAGEPGSMLLYSNLRGAVAELWIDNNMRPCYRVMFLGYNVDTNKYFASQDSGVKIASEFAVNANNLGGDPIYLRARINSRYSGKSDIKRNVEIASYKPADFSNYEENYYLQNIGTPSNSLKGVSGPGTLISGRYTPLEGNSNASAGNSGSSSGSGSSGGNPGGGGEIIEIN